MWGTLVIKSKQVPSKEGYSQRLRGFQLIKATKDEIHPRYFQLQDLWKGTERKTFIFLKATANQSRQ